MTISEHLTYEPRTKKVLAELAGTTVREVELLIHAARLEGVPILSSSDGYWLSRDPAELKACARRLRSRAVTQLITARALKRTAEKMPMTLGLS